MLLGVGPCGRHAGARDRPAAVITGADEDRVRVPRRPSVGAVGPERLLVAGRVVPAAVRAVIGMFTSSCLAAMQAASSLLIFGSSIAALSLYRRRHRPTYDNNRVGQLLDVVLAGYRCRGPRQWAHVRAPSTDRVTDAALRQPDLLWHRHRRGSRCRSTPCRFTQKVPV